MKRKKTRAPQPKETPILFGFMVQRRSGSGRVTIGFRWGRILTAAFALFVAAWLSVAGLLYFFFKYKRDFEAVSYGKMILLPFRLDTHRKEMGNYHIEKGIQAAKDAEYRDAIRLLRIGLLRAPENLEGRILLSEFYEAGLRRPDLASEILVQGVAHGGRDDVDYMRRTFQVLLRNQMDAEVKDIASEILPEEPEMTPLNAMVAFAAANANYLRGDYDAADDLLADYSLLNSTDGIVLAASINWDRGQRAAAIGILEQAIGRWPNAEQIYLQLSRYYREENLLDEARRYAVLRTGSNPLSYGPRIELLYIYNRSGDEDRERTEIQRVLRQFRNEPAAMLALANFAADTGNIPVARRTYEEALENEFDISSFALLLIEAHLVAEDFGGALGFAEELLKERPDWLDANMAAFNSLRAVASYGQNRSDLGEIYLQEFLGNLDNPVDTMLAVARRLAEIDHRTEARRVLATAYERNPGNQRALTELIRIDLELGNTGNLSEMLTRLLKMRRPSTELLREAYDKLGSDRFIFTEDRESLLLQINALLKDSATPAQLSEA